MSKDMEQRQMIDLAAKYFLGTLSGKEKRILDYYLGGCSENERQAFFGLVDEQRTLADLRDLYAVSPEPAADSIRVTPPGGMTRVVRSWRWIISTAAVLLLFFGSIILWGRYNGREKTLNVGVALSEGRITPGGNRARLVLTDGQVVTLDSLTVGSVTQQGNVSVVKRSNGQIAYRFDQAQNHNPYPNHGYNTLETPVGGQYQVVLPDQTKVWLDASSSIRFPTSFNGLAERRVEIKGEAYLEVARDSEHPFFVSVGTTEVQVLGTHFNIMAYPDEPAMKTTLLEGRVKVTHGSASVLLERGEQVLVKAGGLSVDRQPDLESAIAWKEGNFVFAGADIATVMRSLSRWYGIQVEYEGPKSTYTISANVGRSNEIGEVLSMLENAGFHFKIKEGKTVIVYQ